MKSANLDADTNNTPTRFDNIAIVGTMVLAVASWICLIQSLFASGITPMGFYGSSKLVNLDLFFFDWAGTSSDLYLILSIFTALPVVGIGTWLLKKSKNKWIRITAGIAMISMLPQLALSLFFLKYL